jgi:methyl-accepting chemotaxis protein
MMGFLSRLSISRQFILLAVLGVMLTVAGVGLSLARSRDLAYTAKRAEIQHEAEEGATIARHFLQLEQSGALTRADAQTRALEAIKAIKFDGTNYVAVLRFDGFSLANANKNMEGHNVLELKDAFGQPISRAQLAVATSGQPGFVKFHFKKIGENQPKLKMSYNIGISEWEWDVTTGQFADDLDTTLIKSIIQLAEVFIPLFIGFLAIVYAMHKSVSKLLSSLSGAMGRLSAGQLDADIVGRGRKDEIGRMAEALVAFREAALEKLQLQKQAADQQATIEQQRLSDEAVRERAAKDQAQVVGAVGMGLDKLSSGDLTFRLQDAFSAEYEKLRADYNAAMVKLQDTMTTVIGRTDGIRGGSNEITKASDDLSRRTEQQAASLEETAAALDQITATVKKTAEGAVEARGVVANAKDDAEKSAIVVRDAVGAMGKIEESSRQISQIIGVIDEIAFQTNLLALNAGVEAARAGDAGRGFAVVASEVRALAQRSAEAAKEIKALISASTQQVAQGVNLVGETGRALERISTQVSQINGVVTEIAASAQEQATGLHEVNTAVNQMDQVTQQNAAMVEEATAAAHSLREETDALSDLIGQFRVSAAKTGAMASRPAPRPSSPALPVQERIVKFAGGGRAHGGQAALVASAAESWEDL